MKRIDRVLFISLVIAGVLATLMGVPWTIAVLRASSPGGMIDWPTVWLPAALEALLLLPAASAAGVWLGPKLGLGLQLVRELLALQLDEMWPRARRALFPAVSTGGILGVVGIWAQEALPQGALIGGLSAPDSLETTLRAASAAVTEEILFRLGLLTLFVWVFRRFFRSPFLRTPSLWVGNLLAALLFAAAHLPQVRTAAYGWDLLLPVMAFSTVSGLIVGWSYVRSGLISAIIVHFLADFVVYVLPLWLAALR